MINPEQRSLLTDALTPPDRYCYECGVATTYSLDLITLLTLPLHLARRDTEETSPDRQDPLPVLDALRRMGDRLTVVCQRGRLQVPRKSNALLGLLEDMVHETRAPHEGVFHPKVWLLRFVPNEPDGKAPTRLRLLVLTRNITDDRSWDLSLWLEGDRGKKPVGTSRPLAAFIEWLSRAGKETMSIARRKQIELLAVDARHTQWTAPGRFSEVRFHPLGIDAKATQWFPEPASGMLWKQLGVISPFVSSDALDALSARARESLFLVSRAEELDRCASHGRFSDVRVLSDHATSGDTEDDAVHRQRGLHAKVYVGTRAWDTHLFVGSANATGAALAGGCNVEFVVELIGRTSKVGGPSDWVGGDGIGPLLEPYVRSAPVDEQAMKDERALEHLRDELARAPLALYCDEADQGWHVALRGIDGVNWNGAAARAWLVSSDEALAVPVNPRPLNVTHDPQQQGVALGEFASQHITSFTGFLLARGDATLSFALKLPLFGGPEERDLQILRAAIRNRDGLVRYLMLLLGDWASDDGNGQGEGMSHSDGRRPSFDDAALFEMLARAYAHEPARLVQIRDLVERLRRPDSSEHDREPILTADLMELWSVFESALAERENR
ncbi:phospholipase D family protein [Burkholderia contaminans]|uniref:phospholipase D family protein n=1 Tax=Burkholderia contaminans TaxID=488447 RepID=UPI000F561894|nr:phospholipase D family protein [Burkholderia contaminans]RQT38701.1 hypothetical protein DF036_07970 [Burkholderia contaminans]